ncbi:uncharacterized protein LOC121724918 [Alosa sapidissima]|uniref:uncharacterized protein LOC121724918 n=1 Tax=Alosa sapidissima TaxID=34773 RepID=UPI001C07F3F6|nr:uncharacterized protein LOC121724918 [Alosa sapidissima]XP_041967793.1 uncharacterized protein LOC121724918 [Alosa sapidissima]
MDEAPAREGAGTVNAVLMPWFMGGPWIPKFSGKGGGATYGEWQAQIEAFLRAQGLSGQQKLDFILSALEGEAKQEVLLAEPDKRDTDTNLFALLKTLYGKAEPVAQLRAKFFQCRQGVDEGVGAFVLRLRELHHRWRAVDPAPVGGDDEMLRAQFLMGLKPGPVQQELQRQPRRLPGLTFAETCTEAKALEKELQQEEAHVCRTQMAQLAPTATATDPTWQQWKDSLKSELQQELKEQVSALSKNLLEEFKKLHLQDSQGEVIQRIRDAPATASSSRPRHTRPAGEPRSFQWDAQGRPICRDCGESGHVQRFCPRRRQNF